MRYWGIQNGTETGRGERRELTLKKQLTGQSTPIRETTFVAKTLLQREVQAQRWLYW